MGRSLPPIVRLAKCRPTPRCGRITNGLGNLAQDLRLCLRTHWPLKGTLLKMLTFFEPLAWVFITLPAESAGSGVSLCRAES